MICVQISYTKQKPVKVLPARTYMLVTPRTLGPWDPDPPLQLPPRSPTASPASDSFFGYSTATSGKLNLAPRVVGSRMDLSPTDLEAAVDQGPSCPEHPSRHPLRVHQTYHRVLVQACSCRSCCSYCSWYSCSSRSSQQHSLPELTRRPFGLAEVKFGVGSVSFRFVGGRASVVSGC